MEIAINKFSKYPKRRPEPLELVLSEAGEDVEVYVQNGADLDPDVKGAYIDLNREEVTKVVAWLIDWLGQPQEEQRNKPDPDGPGPLPAGL
jgi:hypothetical protein